MSISGIIKKLSLLWRRGLRPGSPEAYSLAIVCAAIATCLRLSLDLINSDLVPFVAFYPAILLVTFLGGVSAGILTLGLGAAASWWLYLLPNFASRAIKVHDAIDLSIYIAIGIVVILVSENLRRIRQKLFESFDSASELLAIVNYSGDAIVGLSLDQTIKTWNAGAERLFGYSANEMVGQPLRALVPPDRLEEPLKFWPRSSTGEMLHFETVRVGKEGRRIDVSVSTGPIRSKTGNIVRVSAIFHDITDRKQKEEHIAFIMREVTHRAKNLLTVIQAIARQTALHTTSMDEFERHFSARIQALSSSHDVLVNQDWHGGLLGDLVTGQLTLFADISHRIATNGPRVLLKPKAVEQIGIALHELATNALKYGALSVAQGTVNISWKLERGKDKAKLLSINWRERGGPIATASEQQGFGNLVVKRIVPDTLNGSASLEFLPEGISWTLEIPTTHVLENEGSAPQ
jgi:PAS domain S-box-containing protein